MKGKQRMNWLPMACLIWMLGVMSMVIPSRAATLQDGDYEYEYITQTGTEDQTVKITKYVGSATDVTIPATLGGGKVTVIGDEAFMNCDKIQKVTIPDGVTKIGDKGNVNAVAGAFYECTALEEITIPQSVKSIAWYAFLRCSSLKTLDLPEGVTEIGWGAFEGCSSLSSVELPASLTKIEYGLFTDCDLDGITVADGNPNYYSEGNCLINRSSKELIQGCNNSVIPKDVTSIGWNAFVGCKKLKAITIPDGVTSLGVQAFMNCTGLEKIVLPEGITSINGNTFLNCSSLQEIKLPESLLTIGQMAFDGCKQLKEITIPNKVTEISNGTFYECSALEHITIPDSVTSIGVQAFRSCSSLKKVTLSANITAIEAGTFKDCSALEEIDIPEGVTRIGGDGVFEQAFTGCSSLRKVSIPASVTSIADGEFQCRESDGDGGGTLYIPEALKIYTTPGSYAAEWVKENASDNDSSATPAPVPQPDQKPSQDATQTTPSQPDQNTGKKPAVKGKVLAVTKYKCKVRVISDDVKAPKVEYLATTNKKASTIKVPDSVTVDGITYKVTAVAAKALSGNKKVKKIVLGANVVSIGKNAFAKCKNLKSIQVKSKAWNKKSVGKNALKGTNKKLVVKVPKKKAAVYKKYLKGKGNKTLKVK